MAQQFLNEANNDEITIFLKHFRLSQYDTKLKSSGLENLQIIHELQEDDINEIITDANLKTCDVKTFKKAINAVKNGRYNSNKQQEEFKYEYKRIEYNKNFDTNKRDNKTIIFIGESGVGKTMTINSMCNYLCNVNYNNKFRYKLIDEMQNQTQQINKYHLNKTNLSKINYSLTIIDTPGFGNTDKSNQNDTIIKTKLKKCFNEIKFINAIYFVVKATDTRLSDLQKYTFNMIYKLFYNIDNIDNNIFLLYTFSDGADPPALKGIKKLNIKYNTYFKINNSGFTFPDSNNNNNNNNTHKMYFNLGIKQFDLIFNELNKVKPKSTKQMYIERSHDSHIIEMEESDDETKSLLHNNTEIISSNKKQNDFSTIKVICGVIIFFVVVMFLFNKILYKD